MKDNSYTNAELAGAKRVYKMANAYMRETSGYPTAHDIIDAAADTLSSMADKNSNLFRVYTDCVYLQNGWKTQNVIVMAAFADEIVEDLCGCLAEILDIEG